MNSEEKFVTIFLWLGIFSVCTFILIAAALFGGKPDLIDAYACRVAKADTSKLCQRFLFSSRARVVERTTTTVERLPSEDGVPNQ